MNPAPDARESVADELRRLVREYHEPGAESAEAWNLIADCVVENIDEIGRALDSASLPAQPREHDPAIMRAAMWQESEEYSTDGLEQCAFRDGVRWTLARLSGTPAQPVSTSPSVKEG